jgi:hypothetical protein
MRLEDEIAENQTIEQLLGGLGVYSAPILFLICYALAVGEVGTMVTSSW